MDLDSLIQRARYPPQHCQGVAFVIGVLKAADEIHAIPTTQDCYNLKSMKPGA